MPDPIRFDTQTTHDCNPAVEGGSIFESGSGGEATEGDLMASPIAAWGEEIELDEGVTLADLVPSPTDADLVIGPAQPTARYEALVIETPQILAAGEAGPAITDPANASRLVKIPIEEFTHRYTGEVRSYEFNVRGGATDEGKTIASIFEWCLQNGGVGVNKVIIRARDPLDSIYLNRLVTLYASNTHVEFRSPLVYGERGGLRVFGDQPEVLRNGKTAKAKLRATADSGQNILELSDSDLDAMQASDFVVGDKIVLRGENDVYGKALTKQEVHVAEIDLINNNLVLSEELEFDFEPTYPGSDWLPDLTTGSTIALAAFAALTVNAAANDVRITVNRTQLEASGIVAGSMVRVSTDETEGDININAHSGSPRTTSTSSLTIGTGSKAFTVASASGFSEGQYIRARNTQSQWMAGRVTSVVGSVVTLSVDATAGAGTLASWTLDKPYSNTARLEWKIVRSIAIIDADESYVSFDSPLVDAYAVARYGGITLVTPAVNSIIRGARVTYNDTQLSRNTHGIQLGYCYNSHIIDCEVDGSGGQKGNGIRISDSLDCTVSRSRVVEPMFSGSSEGYGVALYTSDRCRVLQSHASGCRHNFLLQKTNHITLDGCESVNDLISGIDIHGVRSFNTHIRGCRVIGGPGISDEEADNKSLIRVGNTSHACGDYNTLIEGCYISGARASVAPFTDISTYAGIEVFGASADIIIQNNVFVDCDQGIRAGYDNFRNSSGSNPHIETDPYLNLFEQGNRFIRCDEFTDLATEYGSTEVTIGGRKIVNGSTTTDLSLSTTIPIDGSIPTNAEGTEVLTTSYTPCAPQIRLTFSIPVIEISTSVAVVAAVFIDGTFSFAWVHRVTSGSTPPDGIIATKIIDVTPGAKTISVRVGPHSAATITLNPTGNNWGNNTRVCPFLVIEEG